MRPSLVLVERQAICKKAMEVLAKMKDYDMKVRCVQFNIRSIQNNSFICIIYCTALLFYCNDLFTIIICTNVR